MPVRSAGMSLKTDITVGICAMDKKAEGKPMRELMKRLEAMGPIKFVRFGDELLLNAPVSVLEGPVEEWPECQVLIAFYSDGFPLGKAMEYKEKHPNMMSLNDLNIQNHLFDRRWVYKLCDDHNIPTPRHVFCNRGEDMRGTIMDGMVPTDDFPTPWPSSELEESEDYIVVDGQRFDKPFVEKPVSGENHNVWIYYPRSAGGGVKKLFRKVGNKSSDFCPDENKVRRDGSYIYEEFMPTEGTDVKVYAVGEEYAHAEARKSPVVDGVVARSSDGKEVRYPIILSRKQKKMAFDVVKAFKQTVCGFDLLVCGNKSYVCDVNGWSFVKSSKRFWDDAASQLVRLMKFHQRKMRTHAGHFMQSMDDLSRITSSPEDEAEPSPSAAGESESPGSTKKLRCVVAIIRHADRTPKQKMKLKLVPGGPCQELLDLMTEIMQSEKKDKKKDKDKDKEKEKSKEVQETGQPGPQSPGPRPPIDAPPETPKTNSPPDKPIASSSPAKEGKEDKEDKGDKENKDAGAKKSKDGKYKDKDKSCKDKDKDKDKEKDSMKEVKLKTALHLTMCLERTRAILEKLRAAPDQSPPEEVRKLEQIKTVLEKGGKFEGINRKVQIKPTKWIEQADGPPEVTEALMVLKWGGSLTDVGLEQASRLGQRFREELFPGDSNRFLRLHNSYQHDLKIYSSDEGRVQTTAAAFTKSFLDLEGELTPILVSLVSKDQQAHSMLDSSGVKLSKTVQDEVKTTIREFLQKDGQYDQFGKKFESKCDLRPLHKALQKINNPQEALVSLRNNIAKLLHQLDLRIHEAKRINQATPAGAVHTCEATQDVADMLELDNGETLRLMHSRWEKLYNDLWSAKKEAKEAFDMSKIPDIYDCCKYDAIHSQHSLGLTVLDEMYETARSLAEFVCPSEYGLSRSQRLKIGCTICHNLVEKIGRDMKGSVRESMKALKEENKDETSESDDENTTLKFNKHFLDDVKQQEDDFVEDSIKTRLYFTSESHLHTVISALRFINVQGIDGDGGKAKKSKEIFDSDEQNAIENIPEFDYLTQIVFKVFEDTSAKEHSPERFYVQIGLSPGVAGDARALGKKHLDCQPVIWFPQTEGKVVTFTNLERTLKSIRDHVDKSRNQWVALEALSTRVEGEENADERAERIAFELLREEEEAKVKQAIAQEVHKVRQQEEVAEKKDKEDREADNEAP